MIDDETEREKIIQSEKVRTVISKETANTLKVMLREWVENADNDGLFNDYKMAGISGSSMKRNEDIVASFAGFAPYDNPEIVCLVIIDEPAIDINSSEYLALQVAQDIISEVLDYLNKPKS
ncbi:penicillin-binding transpeptidase domain-containing protein [Herbivorax sp. ANBcel31]|uniref:penicillin-binding transpeptidase domain-containing protein n=1 Tax=Herbivorax sp. ANBcel31 TaxID=3069754 RepID=UPI0027AFE112|nr:penicillin-binding transpeptidase domain-containing protein [Herbivorax sp. ANBcel31]MDQ2085822.1 penicillin-binding transpeptidase domain-containing protein [Herbivorax sp. ANBcel31]